LRCGLTGRRPHLKNYKAQRAAAYWKLSTFSNRTGPTRSAEQALEPRFRGPVGTVGNLPPPRAGEDGDGPALCSDEPVLFEQVQRDRDAGAPHAEHDGKN